MYVLVIQTDWQASVVGVYHNGRMCNQWWNSMVHDTHDSIPCTSTIYTYSPLFHCAFFLPIIYIFQEPSCLCNAWIKKPPNTPFNGTLLSNFTTKCPTSTTLNCLFRISWITIVPSNYVSELWNSREKWDIDQNLVQLLHILPPVLDNLKSRYSTFDLKNRCSSILKFFTYTVLVYDQKSSKHKHPGGEMNKLGR